MARSQKKLAAMPFTVNKLRAVGIRRCDLKHISAFNLLTGSGAQRCRRRLGAHQSLCKRHSELAAFYAAARSHGHTITPL